MKASSALALTALLTALSDPVAAERIHRLPAGYRHGRCLYTVEGKQRIAGRCFHKMDGDGGFHIDGPRQAFGGTDTVDRGASALTYSRDWWVDVFREEGSWSGYGNGDIKSVHGERTWKLHRRGACFEGDGVRICLWRD